MREPTETDLESVNQHPHTEDEFASLYARMFTERGGVTPADPLEFHFYHLTTYWSRLVGFCRLKPGECAGWADGSMGMTMKIASRSADALIDSTSPILPSWNTYKQLAEIVLHHRPLTLGNVEDASDAFDRCRSEAGADPLSAPPADCRHHQIAKASVRFRTTARRIALAGGVLVYACLLLPFLLLGEQWGMMWFLLAAPFSFILEKMIGIQSGSFPLIGIASVATAIMWAGIIHRLARLMLERKQ